MIALFKYSPREETNKKTHSVQSLKPNLDKWVREEGVHVSTIFKKLDKNLNPAAKKRATLNFQLHRISKKFIEGHINIEKILENLSTGRSVNWVIYRKTVSFKILWFLERTTV